jgi:hypothetical protein
VTKHEKSKYLQSETVENIATRKFLDRMPVILDEKAATEWLDSQSEVQELTNLLKLADEKLLFANTGLDPRQLAEERRPEVRRATWLRQSDGKPRGPRSGKGRDAKEQMRPC